MKTRTLTGCILSTTDKAYLIDYGQKTERKAWIPKKIIKSMEPDYLYPEIMILEIESWENPERETVCQLAEYDRF